MARTVADAFDQYHREYVKPNMDSKAPIESPELTGIPTVPTADNDTDSAQIASTEFCQNLIRRLVGAAPETLNTLVELAVAINRDPNFAQTVIQALDTKLNKTDANNTYLSKTEATNTYLTKTDANNTYLSKTEATNTYLTKSSANTTYAKKTDIPNTSGFATTAALADYAKKSDLKAGVVLNENAVIKFGDSDDGVHLIAGNTSTFRINFDAGKQASMTFNGSTGTISCVCDKFTINGREI